MSSHFQQLTVNCLLEKKFPKIFSELLGADKECGKYTCYESDLWAAACIVYFMLGGLPPFRGNSEYIIFKKIEQLDFDFPDTFHDQGKLLVQSLIKERDHELIILGNIFVNTLGTLNKKQLILRKMG